MRSQLRASMSAEQRSVSTRRSGSRARIAFMSCPAYGLGTWWRNATPRAPSSASTCSRWPSSSRASCESVTGSSRRSAYLKRRLTAVDAAFFSQWAWSRRISSRCAHARTTHAGPVVGARLNMARSYHVGGARQNGGPPPPPLRPPAGASPPPRRAGVWPFLLPPAPPRAAASPPEPAATAAGDGVGVADDRLAHAAVIARVGRERAVLAVGLGREVRLDYSRVPAAGQPDEVIGSRSPDERRELGRRPRRELADGRDPGAGERGLGDRADAPQAPRRQRVQKGGDPVGRHFEEPVGLRQVARDLRHHLARPDADRDRESRRGAHAVLEQPADRERRPEEAA